MSRRRLQFALIWVATLATTLTAHAADEVADPDAAPPVDTVISQRLASLEAEVQRLRQLTQASPAAASNSADPASPPAADSVMQPACGPMIGGDFFNCQPRTGGIVAGVEVVYFKPFYTAGGEPNVDAAASNPFTGFTNYPQMSYNFQAAPRVWFGYVGANGLGGRFRFFNYRQTATNDVSTVFTAPPNTFTQTGMLALRTFDLELTQQINFRYWSLQGFGGVRYAQANQQSDVTIFGGSVTKSSLSYYGTGPTGGLQGERALTSSGRLSLFFSGRGSLLFGHQRDQTQDFMFLYTNGNRLFSDAFASIWELNLGPQWKMHLPCGCDFFARATVEGQYWQGVGNFAPIGTSPSPGLNHNNDAGGFGLLGFGGAIGITR